MRHLTMAAVWFGILMGGCLEYRIKPATITNEPEDTSAHPAKGPVHDPTPIAYMSTQIAGAQLTSHGSFISVRGDAIDPPGFVTDSGNMSSAETPVMDLCFLAMTDGVKDPTGGTPTFVSPDLIRTDLNWSTVNKTVIVKTARPVTGFRTVQDIKDAIDRSTSGSAVVMQGGVYALRMSNGKHAILNVTSLAGSNGNAVVNFRIMR